MPSIKKYLAVNESFRQGVQGVLIALTALLLLACSGADDPQKNADSESAQAIKVKVTQPIPVNEADRWHLVADVVPEKLSALSFQVPGQIKQRLVEPGDAVRKDQVLMVLDDTDLQLKLKALQAQLTAAESDLVLARKEWQRIKKLFAKKLVSQDAVDNAQNRLNNVKAKVDALRWQLKQIQRQLEYTRLKAPEDGVIISLLAEVGAVVAAGHPVLNAQIGPRVEFAMGIPAARLHDLPEQAMAQVAGQDIPVQRRYLSPQADPVTRTWPARYAVMDAQALPVALIPGDFAQLWFSQPVREPLLKVPVSAVFAENGQHYVWRVDANSNSPTVHRVEVTLVRSFPAFVWIRGPLSPDDRIVAMGAHLLSDGQVVRIAQP